MSWTEFEETSNNYYPYYDPDEPDFHIMHCPSYKLDEYRGFPLSRTGYASEDALHAAMKEALDDNKLPVDVRTGYEAFRRKEGLDYIGLLD